MNSDNPEHIRSMLEQIKNPEYESSNCEQHGDYQLTVFRNISGGIIRSPCPECDKINKDHEELARMEQQRIDSDAARARHEQRRLEEKIGSALIPKRFQGKTFEQYKVENPNQQRALDACREYALNFDEHFNAGRCLILFGNPGTGKTHLAASIANHLVAKTRHTAIYRSLFAILQSIKNTYGSDSESSESDVFKTLESPGLLIIDEIGATKSTEFEISTLFALINARYEAQLPTVIITNLDATEISGAIGERSADRLRESGGKAVRFDWESMRSKIKGESF